MDERDIVIQDLRAHLREVMRAWECDQQERLKIEELLERAKAYPWYFEFRALVSNMMRVEGLYDVEEIHPDCTVQIWKNSRTGAVSVGWWENGGDADEQG